ncbi:hypothetical protein PMAYCL1PPCAC_26618, partial [Pristionchus mayeri]
RYSTSGTGSGDGKWVLLNDFKCHQGKISVRDKDNQLVDLKRGSTKCTRPKCAACECEFCSAPFPEFV